ncbi:MAG TPA: mechanosensitive ion channel [Anaerolineae bacterium]|nr:mechanosensitive ion channel [Anaerolineae bacterium]
MVQTLLQILQIEPVFRLLNVILIFAVAFLIPRLARRLARLIMRFSDFSFAPQTLPAYLDRLAGTEILTKKLAHLNQWLPTEFQDVAPARQERQQTVKEIIAGVISVLAFTLAAFAALGQFASPTTVVTVAGLLISALAFAGRDVISNYIAGLGIVFQDQFNVGEKIKVKAQLETIEGTVEHVSLNATWLRARTGELYVISNGEMRFICNYSRGLYSAANVTLKIAARDLGRALPLLRHLGQEATTLLEDLREPWQVISESGVMAEQIELTLAVRAHFGHAVSLRPRLLSLVHERLAQAGIELV